MSWLSKTWLHSILKRKKTGIKNVLPNDVKFGFRHITLNKFQTYIAYKNKTNLTDIENYAVK